MSEPLELGRRIVTGGFFVRRRAPRALFAPRDADGEPYRHCFTYAGSQPSIRTELITMLAAARRKVFVASWLLGDDEVLDQLAGAAERLRGGVYVISALQPRDIAEAARLEDDVPESQQVVKRRFEALTSRGVYVRTRPGCHAKFVVVDDRTALVSSANLMTSALDRTGENGVVMTEPTEVDRLARLFTRLWHGCPLEIPPGIGYKIAEAETTPWLGLVPQPDPDQLGVIWTCDAEHHILATIQSLIGSAKQDLLLATFSIEGMGANPDLVLTHTQAAVDRGVRARLLVRARNNKPGHLADLLMFARAGVEVIGDSLTHAKGVVADNRRGALFSANFEAKHGLCDGVEVGTRLDRTPALDEAIRYFNHVIDHADQTFVVDPTIDELDRGLTSSWYKRWPLPRQVRVMVKDRDWRRLNKAVETGGPVLYEETGQTISLYAAEMCWRLTRPGDDSDRSLELTRTTGQPAIARLRDWFADPGSGARSTSRGLCPATFAPSLSP